MQDTQPIRTMPEAYELVMRMQKDFARLHEYFAVNMGKAVTDNGFHPSADSVIVTHSHLPLAKPPTALLEGLTTWTNRVYSIVEEAKGSYLRPDQIRDRYVALKLPLFDHPNIYTKVYSALVQLKDTKRVDYAEGRGYRIQPATTDAPSPLLRMPATILPANSIPTSKAEEEVVHF